VVWLRITGLALLIAGALSLLLLPTWGRIGLVSVALIVVGAIALSLAKKDRRSCDDLSGGVYGDATNSYRVPCLRRVQGTNVDIGIR
jgi:hypothetical protein